MEITHSSRVRDVSEEEARNCVIVTKALAGVTLGKVWLWDDGTFSFRLPGGSCAWPASSEADAVAQLLVANFA
jgi:hypothetical protein